jgi:hypothetical protein
MDAAADSQIDVKVAPSPEGERVATYWTLDGARHAVTHLAERGFDPHRFAIRPGSLEPVGAPAVGAPPRIGTFAGAALGVAAGAVGGLVLRGRVAWPLVALGVVASVLGAMALLAVLRRAEQRRAAGDRLAASRFDVVYDGPDAEARHLLARWWDARALPAPPASRARRVAA